ncbi:hypothetical protein BpHYR1_011293 [Brachionus plicatilis]|uniref:Uncharacterized protein n=1 Tax=Brachionus plicatilis TaxID=10195 RepID=A0A3M7QSL7_BRAPC|nr:hypothetical protein BpHYR1_011293 [Brachionus plicatilis]
MKFDASTKMFVDCHFRKVLWKYPLCNTWFDLYNFNIKYFLIQCQFEKWIFDNYTLFFKTNVSNLLVKLLDQLYLEEQGLVENVNNCSQKNVTMSIKSKYQLLLKKL